MSHPDPTYDPSEDLDRLHEDIQKIEEGDRNHDRRKEDEMMNALGHKHSLDEKGFCVVCGCFVQTYSSPTPQGRKEGKVMVAIVQKQIMGSTWCVKCWPEREYAEFIKEGNGVCEKHL